MSNQRSCRLDPISMVSHGMIWFSDEIELEQPERYNMNFRNVRRWERVKEMSTMNKRWDARKINEMTTEQVKKALEEAVKDMNNWLFKGSFGDHPNNVFVNFLKKSLGKQAGGLAMLDRDTKNGLMPNSILVTVKDNSVADVHFYATNWPSYAVELLQKLREEAVKLNFKGLKGSANIDSLSVSNRLDSVVENLKTFNFKL